MSGLGPGASLLLGARACTATTVVRSAAQQAQITRHDSAMSPIDSSSWKGNKNCHRLLQRSHWCRCDGACRPGSPFPR